MKQIFYILLFLLVWAGAWGQAGRLHRLAGPDTTVIATKAFANTKSTNEDTLNINTNISSIFVGTTVSRLRRLNIKANINGSASSDIYIDVPSILDGEMSVTTSDSSDTYKSILRSESFFWTNSGRKVSEYYLDNGESVSLKPSPNGVVLIAGFKSIINGKNDVVSERYIPGDRVQINGGWYDVKTYPEYGYSNVDTVISIPTNVKAKSGENLFTHSKHFWSETLSGVRWGNLNDNYIVTENDTIHPITGLRTVPKFELDNTTANIRYNALNLDGYYQPDSIYTVSFWARHGKDAASSNAELYAILQYSGNPDASSGALGITDEWQYFQVELTALGASRTFVSFDFQITGDVGDVVYVTDPKLERGSSISGQEFYPTTDSVFVNQRLFANLQLENGGINYDNVKGALGSDVTTINYLSDICQDTEGCNFIYSTTGFEIQPGEQLLLREGVIIQGTHTGSAITGNNSDIFQGPRIVLDLQDTTAIGIRPTGPSQIDGVGIKGFIIEIISGGYAAIGTGDALNMQIEDISFLGPLDSLLYGIVFESGSLDCNVNNVSALGKYAGFYGTSSLVRIYDSKYLGGGIGADITGGSWELYSCWFEDLSNSAIRYNSLGNELKVVDVYVEHAPQAGNPGVPMFDIKAAKNIEFTRGNLSMQPGVDETNIVFALDTVGVATIKSNDFGNVGGPLVTSTDYTGAIVAIGNNHPQLNGFFNYDTWEGIADSCSVVSIGNTYRLVTSTVRPDKNWIGCFETTGFKLKDGLLLGYDDNEIQGEIVFRSDTVTLVGTQNLVRYSEQINQVTEWNDIGTITVTTDYANNDDGELKAELLEPSGGYASMRVNGLTTSTFLKYNTAYTFKYDAKLPTASSEMVIRPDINVSGAGDVLGELDTITTSWQTYTQTIISPDSDKTGMVMDFEFFGDSVLFTKVSITEGYFNDAYVETGASNATAKEVVFNGDMTVTGTLTADPSYFFTTGTATPTTDLSGQFTITHGLGITPSHLSVGNLSGTEYNFEYSCGSTSCTVTVYDGTGTDTTVNSTGISISWAALR